ncbi:poly(ethylene terephthalate) hydrolase family protein [Streptomyces marispadix]|uniref:GDSL-type esterase/lipase family protein n=1 Tax=Streptomyces marispadix TaxID=2922868 RepID=A0ABS9T2B0_9ACTN|nr:GDSL-type esterase/lipase family protein [Streptomyces marispadix]MCH6162598.1 GDSL-type esterase/lipase family protein [Streptomyces marispadix]
MTWRRRIAGPLIAVLSALTLLTLPALPTAAAAPEEPAPATESAAAPWEEPGPYGVKVKIGATHTFYYPDGMGDGGRKHPVILWGNGTGVIPGVYSALLRHWAGQGFIVVAANTPNGNFGISMLHGIDKLTEWNADPRSEFHDRVDLANIGASGHSQGGSGAINAGADGRVKTTAPIQPGPLNSPSALRGPALFLAGERDLIVPPALVRSLYDQADQVPAVYAELKGARHVTTVGDAGGFRGATTAWFRHQLMGDAAAGALFYGPDCGLCDDPAWSDFRRNSRAEPSTTATNTATTANAAATATWDAATANAGSPAAKATAATETTTAAKASTPAQQSEKIRYVALGDSAATGPLILPPDLRQPGCLRTTRNYPARTARALGTAEFTDVTCSSAKTTDLTGSQRTPMGAVPPQLDALDADTTLVTLHIGANDISLSSLVGDCLNPLRLPLKSRCADTYQDNGRDEWKERIAGLAPRIDDAIGAIQRPCPRGRGARRRLWQLPAARRLPPQGADPAARRHLRPKHHRAPQHDAGTARRREGRPLHRPGGREHGTRRLPSAGHPLDRALRACVPRRPVPPQRPWHERVRRHRHGGRHRRLTPGIDRSLSGARLPEPRGHAPTAEARLAAPAKTPSIRPGDAHPAGARFVPATGVHTRSDLTPSIAAFRGSRDGPAPPEQR